MRYSVICLKDFNYGGHEFEGGVEYIAEETSCGRIYYEILDIDGSNFMVYLDEFEFYRHFDFTAGLLKEVNYLFNKIME